MSDKDANDPADPHVAESAEAIAKAILRAEAALDAVKKSLAEGKLHEIGAQASAAASTLLNEAEDLMEHSQTLHKAREDLSGAVRRNPLASLGIAFGLGLLFALFTRG